jgi:OFA family oxalate/formate antiporter-like MFS transporter
MLTAWGFAGVFGPLLIANIRQATGKYDRALTIIAAIMLVSSVLPLVLRRHRAVGEPIAAKPVERV